MIWNNLELIDKIVLVGLVLVTMILSLIGFFRTRYLIGHDSRKSVFEYLLMSRQLTLPFFVATLVATWYGGIFAVTQIAFENGIYNFLTQGLFWYLAYIIFAIYVLPKIWQSNSLTITEFIAKKIGSKAMKITGILLIIKMLPIVYLISSAIFVSQLFDMSFTMSIALICCFVSIYSAIGGFRGIVLKDMWLFVLMYIGAVTLLIFSMLKYGGISHLTSTLPKEYFSMSGNHEWYYILIWFFIAIVTTIVNPVFFQRCAAVKDIRTARNGILIATVFWFIFDICTTLGAMYAKAAMYDHDSTTAYLQYGLNILPAGFKGLFLGGIAATLLSTVDSFLFIGGTILAYDLCPRFFTNNGMRIFATLIFGLITYQITVLFNAKMEEIWIATELYSNIILVIPLFLAWLFPNKIKINDTIFITYAIFVVICALAINLFLF